jgi:hypothetical protein
MELTNENSYPAYSEPILPHSKTHTAYPPMCYVTSCMEWS